MRIDGLTNDECVIFDNLLTQLANKRDRNMLRTLYYDAKSRPKDLKMLLPPSAYGALGAVLGWPAKAVDTLAQRTYWQGFAAPDDSGIQSEMDELAEANHLEGEMQQAAVSALEHSVAFLVATKGGDNEPPAVITSKDALNGTGTWDPRRRRLSNFLSVIERDESYNPSSVELYLPGWTFSLRYDRSWVLDGDPVRTGLDGLPVEVMPYRPRIGRPFGSSRISRPVMSITDMAIRTVIRAEAGAEFASIPQRYALGVDEAAFNGKNPWEVLLGRVLMLDDDDDRKNPRAELGQFEQASQVPHMDQLRSLAQLFAGETSIPVSSLGISIDSNPTSADSYAASREDIIAEAEAAIRIWNGATSRTMANALALAGIETDTRILSRFRDPRYTSRAAAADAMQKMITSMPWMGESETAVELLGFDEVTTERLKADRRRAQGRAALAALSQQPAVTTNAVAG